MEIDLVAIIPSYNFQFGTDLRFSDFILIPSYNPKGKDVELNFPDSASSLPVLASLSARDIQVAATSAATGAARDALSAGGSSSGVEGIRNNYFSSQEQVEGVNHNQFVDEDLIFDMPNVLVNMAQGMLLSPPPFDIGGEADDNMDQEPSLWNFP
ncbi:putative ethylene-responsive transcription factor [Sesbania bispinosa]|nr:putative ethylene-responsive transcription factor [Sesbania bispinosa]